jgi:hypothetical protein
MRPAEHQRLPTTLMRGPRIDAWGRLGPAPSAGWTGITFLTKTAVTTDGVTAPKPRRCPTSARRSSERARPWQRDSGRIGSSRRFHETLTARRGPGEPGSTGDDAAPSLPRSMANPLTIAPVLSPCGSATSTLRHHSARSIRGAAAPPAVDGRNTARKQKGRPRRTALDACLIGGIRSRCDTARCR